MNHIFRLPLFLLFLFVGGDSFADDCHHEANRVVQTFNRYSLGDNDLLICSAEMYHVIKVDNDAQPSQKYSLQISSIGNGDTEFLGTTIRNSTSSFTLDEGASATITFKPDNGNRLKKVIVNGTDATSSVNNNQLTIENIKSYTAVQVEYEATSLQKYSLQISSIGNGDTEFLGTTIRNGTSSFTLDEGTSATITFKPDNGNRLKKVTVNNSDVTADVSENELAVNITSYTSVQVNYEYTSINCLEKEQLKSVWDNLTHHGNTVYGLNLDYVPNKLMRYYDDNDNAIHEKIMSDEGIINFDLNYSGDSYALEGLIWCRRPDYFEPNYGLRGRSGDEEGWAQMCWQNRFHIWDSPQEALADPYGAALALQALDPMGIDLSRYIGLHCLKNNSGHYDVIEFTYGEERLLGLHYEFEFVDYYLNNGSHESHYATFSDWESENWNKTTSKSGVVIARSGYGENYQSTASAGHEPLVRVMLKNDYGDVFLDGYILLHIPTSIMTHTLKLNVSGNGALIYNKTEIRNKTCTLAITNDYSTTIKLVPDNGYHVRSIKKNGLDVTSSIVNNTLALNNIILDTSLEVEFGEDVIVGTDNFNVDLYPIVTKTFDHNNSVVFTTTWNQFQDIILHNCLNISIDAFNNSYWADCKTGGTVASKDDGFVTPNAISVSVPDYGNGYQLKVFNFGIDIFGNGNIPPAIGDANEEVNNTFENKELGTAVFFPHGEGEGKHTFIWILSKEEAEFLTAGKDNEPITVTRWFRFTAKASAPYRYIWVKMSMQLIREVTTYSLTIKATGNGSVSYGSSTIRNNSSTFSVEEGSPAIISFKPDTGYRVKVATIRSSSGTSYTYSNQYIISEMNIDMEVDVEFEAIPPKTYSLSVSAKGNGFAQYNGTSVRNKTSEFSVVEGSSIKISFTPDAGYHIKTLKSNDKDVTASISNNQYVISNVSQNVTLEVEFEATPPTIYNLSITAYGGGEARFSGQSIRSTTSTFSVSEGTSITIHFYADSGHYIKGVIVNGSDVTPLLSYNQYKEENVRQNLSVEVIFDEIPSTNYNLSITASGNGFATYNGETIRGKTSQFSVKEGSSVTIGFTPDNGYRIKSVKANGSDVTTSLSNIQYIINSLKQDMMIEVVFEAIPSTNYNLTITVSDNGIATYNGETIRGKTNRFSVKDGSSVTIGFTPDNGYRIKSVKANGSDVTTSLSNTQYIINSLKQDMMIEVAFEPIPSTNYNLTITASDNGVATYNGETIRGKTSRFSVKEGSPVIIEFTPDNGYRIKSVKANGSDVTTSLSNTQYIINSLKQDMMIEVAFEAIPSAYYNLSITAIGNGVAKYNGETIRSKTSLYSVKEGSSAMISFIPDSDYRIKSLAVNGFEESDNLENSQYSISSFSQNTTIEVVFDEDIKSFTVENLNYTVTSYNGRLINLAKGNYGDVLEIPSKVTYSNMEWKVAGIENNALSGNDELAAVIWHPEAVFTAPVSNPNLLLFVNELRYAPETIGNVVVNGVADNISLIESADGNNFHCPQDFTAKSISYSHNFKMTTGIGEAKGWESIALPFDVQKVMHEDKGEIVPFAKWQSGDTRNPFWLMHLESSGWKDSDGIKANTPYIISMPNNEKYIEDYLLNGRVIFSSENVVVKKSSDIQSVSYNDRTFVPTFSEIGMGDGAYALNVDNDLVTNISGLTEGSRFVLNLRKVHPFEAYMKSTANGTRSFAISDGMHEITNSEEQLFMRVYNLNGQMIKSGNTVTIEMLRNILPAGIYVVNGRKLLVK